MRAFWIAAESLDLAVIKTLDRIDRVLGRKTASERAAAATENTREPEAAPKFES